MPQVSKESHHCGSPGFTASSPHSWPVCFELIPKFAKNHTRVLGGVLFIKHTSYRESVSLELLLDIVSLSLSLSLSLSCQRKAVNCDTTKEKEKHNPFETSSKLRLPVLLVIVGISSVVCYLTVQGR